MDTTNLMNPRQPTSLVNAVGRIWRLVSGNTSTIDDLLERMIQSFYTKVIRPGDVIVDGGAHTGRHTIPLARLVGEAGLVIAFEPLRSAAVKLSRLLAASGLDARVRLRSEALAHTRGRHDFFVVNNMPEFSGLASRHYVGFVPDQTRIQVDLESIDSALGVAGRVSFIKLDLEGGEFRALEGAESTLRTHGPCCAFENGLESSADGYQAEDFFGYFRRVGYALYDVLGCEVHESRWSESGPFYFVAIPSWRRQELLPLLWASVLEELLTSSWRPTERFGPPPADFARASESLTPGIAGCVDRLETVTRATGWAGDLRSGRPSRSLVITVDGKAVATTHPCKPRFDVAAATGHVGLSDAGFELSLRTQVGERIEIHAESADGTFFKLDTPGT
jgi:FkbM family methyltransferase